jgi:hypothetical protein
MLAILSPTVSEITFTSKGKRLKKVWLLSNILAIFGDVYSGRVKPLAGNLTNASGVRVGKALDN